MFGAFVAMDRLLDRASTGPMSLSQPALARVVVQALHDVEVRFHRYSLHAFVVMPNHVHLLLTPGVAAREWLGPLKGYTAHQANGILGQRGVPYWQDESYDHLVRDQREFERVRRYIEWNPVAAGLAGSAEEFPWSSATPAGRPAAGQKA
jgi:REP element-mobilizing transposase RayT